MESQPEWKSPRKIEEEVRAYQSKRFEDYMAMVDRGELEREIALTALRQELDHTADLRPLTDSQPGSLK